MQDEQLNFETAAGVVESAGDPQAANLLPESAASGLSVGIAILAFLIVSVLAQKLRRKDQAKGTASTDSAKIGHHILSLMVSTFLLLNVMFGGLTAFLLGRTSEDARAYFAEISAFKLAKLSHAHFFGYGVSFGIIAALAICFISPSKRRVMLPVSLMFVFGGLDVASWWLSRFVSFGFHTLSYATGAVFALSFCVVYFQLASVHLKYLLTHKERI